jgi:ribonuclease PH
LATITRVNWLSAASLASGIGARMASVTAASFALIAALSDLSSAHAASFNDRSAIPDAASVQTGRQDLRHVPVVHGFNQQSHIAVAALESTTGAGRNTVAVGANCDLALRLGFNNSTSFASC